MRFKYFIRPSSGQKMSKSGGNSVLCKCPRSRVRKGGGFKGGARAFGDWGRRMNGRIAFHN